VDSTEAILPKFSQTPPGRVSDLLGDLKMFCLLSLTIDQ
jgi:hypothetical protein